MILMSVLKSGIDRSTSTIAIANPGAGTNIEFDIFGTFIFSSCDPLWQNQELFELKRRLIVLRFKKYDFFSEEDLQLNKNPDDLIDLDWFNFDGFFSFKQFWNDERRLEYVKLLKAQWYKKSLKDLTLPTNFIKLYFNLIATAYFINNGYSSQENSEKFTTTAQLFIDYYSKLFKPLISSKTALELWIEDFIELKENEFKSLIDAGILNLPENHPIEIDCNVFNDGITRAYKTGEFYDSLNKKDIKRIMSSHGYRQTRNFESQSDEYKGRPKMVWQKF